MLSLIYFYSHYFFASNTAHISRDVCCVLGRRQWRLVTPPAASCTRVLGFFSNLFSSMTHYSNGPAPVLYGSGYVRLLDWWRLGALVSVVNLVIWLGIGGLWWTAIGLTDLR